MVRSPLLLVLGSSFLVGVPAKAQNAPGHDYPPFSSLEGFTRDRCTDIKYDYFNFPTDEEGKVTRVEGHKLVISYGTRESGRMGSGIELLRTIERLRIRRSH
jgi:hypothetical protein